MLVSIIYQYQRRLRIAIAWCVLEAYIANSVDPLLVFLVFLTVYRAPSLNYI